MNSRLIAVVLAMAAALAGGIADASPRAAQDAGSAMTPDADMDVWLRRLVGKYRVEGMVQVVMEGECGSLPPNPEAEEVEHPPEPPCRTIKGVMDCIPVGTGPGVQCILNVSWNDIYKIVYPPDLFPGVYELPGGTAYLDPAMTLFGLDPGNGRISYLLVDRKGLPEGGLGFVKGNRATFRTECVNAPALFLAMYPNRLHECRRTLYADAKPDARVAHLAMDIEIPQEGDWTVWTRIEMTLRRQLQEEAGVAPGTQP